MPLCHGSLGYLGWERAWLPAAPAGAPCLGSVGEKGRRWPGGGSGGDPKGPLALPRDRPQDHPRLEPAGCGRCAEPRPRSIPGCPVRSAPSWLCRARPVLAPSVPVGPLSSATCSVPSILHRGRPDHFYGFFELSVYA